MLLLILAFLFLRLFKQTLIQAALHAAANPGASCSCASPLHVVGSDLSL
jgi:hypothetical protein